MVEVEIGILVFGFLEDIVVFYVGVVEIEVVDIFYVLYIYC